MTAVQKKNALLNNLDNFLKSIDQENYEIEARIGSFRRESFISNNDPRDFYKILDHFISHTPDIYTFIHHDTTLLTKGAPRPEPNVITEIYFTVDGVNIRESFIDIPEFFTPRIYTVKTNVRNFDFLDYFTRISVSTEEKIATVTSPDQPGPIPQGTQPTAVRVKYRWSFGLADKQLEHPLYPFRVDLTHVKGWYTNKEGKNIPIDTYEIELESIQKIGKNIWDGVNFILSIIQNTEFPISSREASWVRNRYNELFTDEITKSGKKFNKGWRLFNPSNRPINIKQSVIFGPDDLAVTDKADGERKFLFIIERKGYFVYPPSSVSLWKKDIESIDNSLIDGELIETDMGERKYLAFDILFYKGKDVRTLPFVDRIKILESMKNIDMKKYFTEGNFYEKTNATLDSIPFKNYNNDGLVFNLISGDYNSTVYKWKPESQMTIDFHVKQIAPNEFDLYVKQDGENRDVLFLGSDIYPYNRTVISDVIKDRQIVEMMWEKDRFIPLRVRHDRDKANNNSTAISVWRDIMKPITEDTIRGKDLKAMRLLHNAYKKMMLQVDCKNRTILDIGSGRGGDLHKWKHIGASVLAVEPSIEHLVEFEKRAVEMGYKKISKNIFRGNNASTVAIVNTSGQDTDKILRHFKTLITAKGAGCVTLFNVLTFFFKNEKMLDALINTIDSALLDKGIFMGIVMDGVTVKELLKNEDEIGYGDWSIKKAGKFTKSPYGNKIVINLGESTIVNNQVEYLVDFNVFTKKLLERKIHPINNVVMDLPNFNNLPSDQNELSKLYRFFSFKKDVNLKVEGLIIKYEYSPDDFFVTVKK